MSTFQELLDKYLLLQKMQEDAKVECCKCGTTDHAVYMRKIGDLWICEDCDEN